ncbi:MAG: flagellar export protein FliJ [Chlorobi bacterium]|nr:flagellar export protein FliJ [Chlorobiota bacterium]
MARFRFRLQSLLEYRQHLVEEAQQELAHLNARARAIEAAIDQCVQDIDEAAAPTSSVKAHLLQLHDARRQHLVERVYMLKQDLESVRAEQERATERLVQRMQQRQVLDKLRQRRLEEHILDERRTEQQRLDEIAARQHRTGLPAIRSQSC